MSEMEALRAEAQSRYGRGDLQGALETYLQLLAQEPANPETLNDLGTICFELGRLGESERYYVRALALDAGCGEAERNLRMLCQAVGRDFQAVLARAEAERTTENRPPSLDISVVVPVHKEFEVLDKCLDGLYSQTFPPERYEVLVVANGVRGADAQELGSVVNRWRSHFGERLQLLDLAGSSIAMARNEGIAHARGRIVLQINSDAVLSRTALREHYAEHQGFGFDPYCVVVGGRSFPESYKTSFFNYLYEAIPLYTALHEPRPRFPADYNWFVTCNLSCLKEAYDRLGVYDPSFVWGSDQELGMRWQEGRRVRIYVNTNIVGYHLHWQSFDSWKGKCIEGAPHWFRRHMGMAIEELPPEGRDAVREELDSTDFAPAVVEQELRRLEQRWRGPGKFTGDTVMGQLVFTLEELVYRLRLLLRDYRKHLQYTEIWKRVRDAA